MTKQEAISIIMERLTATRKSLPQSKIEAMADQMVRCGVEGLAMIGHAAIEAERSRNTYSAQQNIDAIAGKKND